MRNITKIVTSAICSVGVIIGIIMSDYNDEIRTSRAGLEFIGNVEGCRKAPYHCPADILTVGIGSTSNIENRQYSDDEIAKLWITDIKNAEKCVYQYGNGKNLPQSVFDSAVSIAFNVGCTKIKSSTLFKYLREYKYENACYEFPKWNKSSGVVLSGLVNRRAQERSLCLNGF